MFLKAIYPDWVIKLGPTERLRNVKLAFDELEVRACIRAVYLATDGLLYTQSYMLEMIHKRKNAEKKEERYDLFSSLLDASEEEADGQAKLTDRELLGQFRCVCIFFFTLELTVC